MSKADTTKRRLEPVAKAAEEIGMSVWWLRRKAYEGGCASHKLGNRLMIPRSEIERLVAESERPRLEPTAA